VLGTEVVEEAAPLAEEHRDDMDLELVEDAGSAPVPVRPEPLDERTLVCSRPPAMNAPRRDYQRRLGNSQLHRLDLSIGKQALVQVQRRF
jgi:hypothetical protein